MISQGEIHQEQSQKALHQLVVAIQCRDEAAFNRFYDLTLSHVYKIARAILSAEWLAQEVVCDVYVQVWDNADQYDSGRGAVLAWVAMLTRFRALDRLRLMRHQSARLQTLEDADIDTFADQDCNPQRLLQQFQQYSQVHMLLQAMDELPRQMLLLAFFRGYSHLEIATELQMPLGTVKSCMRKAFQTMRKALKSHLHEEHHD